MSLCLYVPPDVIDICEPQAAEDAEELIIEAKFGWRLLDVEPGVEVARVLGRREPIVTVWKLAISWRRQRRL